MLVEVGRRLADTVFKGPRDDDVIDHDEVVDVPGWKEGGKRGGEEGGEEYYTC